MSMLNSGDRVRAQALPWHGGVELVAYQRFQDGEKKVATVQWETLSENELMRPTLTMRMEQAQILMDDLWHAGVRPTEGAGSAGAMRAAEHHIADLRRVAFKALGIE